MWSENDRNGVRYGDIQLAFFFVTWCGKHPLHPEVRGGRACGCKENKKEATYIPASPQQQHCWKIPIPFWGARKKKVQNPLYLRSFWLVHMLLPQLCPLWWEHMDKLQELEAADMKSQLQGLLIHEAEWGTRKPLDQQNKIHARIKPRIKTHAWIWIWFYKWLFSFFVLIWCRKTFSQWPHSPALVQWHADLQV